jgi:predicted secreted protein
VKEDNYIPGTCNIGNEQLQKRKKFLIKTVSATLLCIVFLQIFHLDKIWRLFMFVPFTLTIIGAQQVYFKFCYLFGLKGYYGFGEVGKAKTVTDEENIKRDKAKARKMILSSVIIGAILTVIYYFFPF